MPTAYTPYDDHNPETATNVYVVVTGGYIDCYCDGPSTVLGAFSDRQTAVSYADDYRSGGHLGPKDWLEILTVPLGVAVFDRDQRPRDDDVVAAEKKRNEELKQQFSADDLARGAVRIYGIDSPEGAKGTLTVLGSDELRLADLSSPPPWVPPVIQLAKDGTKPDPDGLGEEDDGKAWLEGGEMHVYLHDRQSFVVLPYGPIPGSEWYPTLTNPVPPWSRGEDYA